MANKIYKILKIVYGIISLVNLWANGFMLGANKIIIDANGRKSFFVFYSITFFLIIFGGIMFAIVNKEIKQNAVY